LGKPPPGPTPATLQLLVVALTFLVVLVPIEPPRRIVELGRRRLEELSRMVGAPLRVGRFLLRKRGLGLRPFRRGSCLCRRRLGFLCALFGRWTASARDERRERQRCGRTRSAPAAVRAHCG